LTLTLIATGCGGLFERDRGNRANTGNGDDSSGNGDGPEVSLEPYCFPDGYSFVAPFEEDFQAEFVLRHDDYGRLALEQETWECPPEDECDWPMVDSYITSDDGAGFQRLDRHYCSEAQGDDSISCTLRGAAFTDDGGLIIAIAQNSSGTDYLVLSWEESSSQWRVDLPKLEGVRDGEFAGPFIDGGGRLVALAEGFLSADGKTTTRGYLSEGSIWTEIVSSEGDPVDMSGAQLLALDGRLVFEVPGAERRFVELFDDAWHPVDPCILN
jgi:hypothetical protein